MPRLECESRLTEFTTLLIANRGEIARRIMRTAREMGLRTVAIYSQPDRDAPHVLEADVAMPLRGASATATYLDQEQILAAARKAGAEAVHPGYGFLAENAAFADACIKAGLTWIGPSPDVIHRMGLKIVAKDIAREAGVPVAPDALITGDEPAAWQKTAHLIGYPLLVKASAGGGGKGMRLVEHVSELVEAIGGARREAQNSFGDPTVFLERYLPSPRHIEVQIFADAHGNVIHLYERECSLQRRYQKVIEEAPSPGITPELRAKMGEAAVALAQAIGYVGAGTIEYLVEGETFSFLEMNTRLQVEHPVTEGITGLDLVRLQIQIARGERLPLQQEEVACQGHAIEARLYAEDPRAGFLPTFGRLARFEIGQTPGVRYDSAVVSGSEIGTQYDPLLAKVIAHAPTRSEAARRLARALNEMRLHGVRTNRDFLAATLLHPDFLAGETRTDFVSTHTELLNAQPAEATRAIHLLAGIAVLAHRQRANAPVQSFVPGGWRNVRTQGQFRIFEKSDGGLIEAEYVLETGQQPAQLTARLGERTLEAEIYAVDTESARLVVDGVHHVCHVNLVDDMIYVNSAAGQTEWRERPRFVEQETTTIASGPTSRLPGAISAVLVAPGDRVKAGQTLVMLEAMKMEHRITATSNSVVKRVLVKVGDTVSAQQLLVILAEEE